MRFDPDRYVTNAAAARTYQSDAAAEDKLIGTYSGAAGQFVIQRVDKNLHVILGTQNVELIPYAPDSFLANGTLGITISFKAGATDKDPITAYQDGVEIGTRQAASPLYTEPKGRFTVSVPTGLAAVQIGDLGVLQVINPPSTFVVAAEDAPTGEVKDAVQAWLIKYQQIKDEKPDTPRTIPINGATWTQYVYTLADGQLLIVVALKQGNTAYFVSLKAKAADVPRLTAPFNTLLLSFQIKTP